MTYRHFRSSDLLLRWFSFVLLLAAALLALGSLGRARQGLKGDVYNISFDAIRKELSETKKFPLTSEVPSAYLSDFFGLQRIKDLSKAEILKDFVPRLASVAAEKPVLRLRFARGYTASLYLGCSLAVDGNSTGVRQSFVEFSDFQPSFKDRYEALANFLQLLEGLEAKYLVPNPYAAQELIAAADLKSESRPRPAGLAEVDTRTTV